VVILDMAVQPRHSSGQRLADVADVVIDTGVPLGDACVRVDGVADPLAPADGPLPPADDDLPLADDDLDA
jgi:uncharacterized phosphosugar-binding protein